MRSPILHVLALLTLAALLTIPSASAHIQQCEDYGAGFREACETGYVFGLNDALSVAAGAWMVMLFWLLFLVPFVVFVAWLVWWLVPKRLMTVDSKEKIGEVDPGDSKEYSVVVENRLRSRPLEVEFQVGHPPAGWKAALKVANPHASGFTEIVSGNGERHPRLQLAPRRSGHHMAEAVVTVQAAPGASPEEWSELELLAIPWVKGAPAPKKAKEVQLITLIREKEASVAIQGVTHEPADFQPGDLVATTVRVANHGTETSDGRIVRLHLNDQEVAQERLRVGPGEEAALRLEWTAVEGENRVRVTLH